MKNLTAQEFTAMLNDLSACSGAKIFQRGKDLKTVWETCDRGDWMLWLAFRMIGKEGWHTIQQLTMAKVKCARTVQYLMKDKRSLSALDVAERFALGTATRNELNAAADAACAAAYIADVAYVDSAATYAADVAYANACAADVAYANACAADVAYANAYIADVAYVDAAYAAACVANACAADAYVAGSARRTLKTNTLKQCADICMEYLPLKFEK